MWLGYGGYAEHKGYLSVRRESEVVEEVVRVLEGDLGSDLV